MIKINNLKAKNLNLYQGFLIFFLLLFFCIQDSWSQNQSLVIKKSTDFPEINTNLAQPKILGSHNLRVFGLNIYDIALISEENNFSYQNKLAILINYNRNFSKDKLVERSIAEISRINDIKDGAVLDNYKNTLNKIFFDVKKGDRKVAFFDPKKGVKLYFNGILAGVIDDRIFAQRFMDIWLSDKSSYPRMTADIIGKND